MTDMGRTQLVIAGHCTIDDIHQADGSFLPAIPGGAAAYAVVGAAMYGARIRLITLLGDDYPFDRFCAGLAGYGNVSMKGVRWTEPRSTHNVAWYRADGVRHFDIENWEVMERLTPTSAELTPEIIRDAMVLLTPGSVDKQLASTRHVRQQGSPVAVDTEIHYFPTPETKQLLCAIIADATYFLPSIEHLQLLFDSESRDVAAYLDRLVHLGCPCIVVKQGASGSTLVDCRVGQVWQIPAVPDITVRDLTGAGDGFSGGFMAALADGKDLIDAACWGTVTASFVVESIGAIMPAHFTTNLALERYIRLRAAVAQMKDP